MSSDASVRETKVETSGNHPNRQQTKRKPFGSESIKNQTITEPPINQPNIEPPGNMSTKQQTIRDSSINQRTRNQFMKNQLRDQLFMRDPSKPRTRPRVKHTERLKEFANVIEEKVQEIQNKVNINTHTKPQTATSAQSGSSKNTQPSSSRTLGQITKQRLSQDELIHYQLSQDQDSQEPDEPPCEQLTENQLIEILDQSPAHKKTIVNK